MTVPIRTSQNVPSRNSKDPRPAGWPADGRGGTEGGVACVALIGSGAADVAITGAGVGFGSLETATGALGATIGEGRITGGMGIGAGAGVGFGAAGAGAAGL